MGEVAGTTGVTVSGWALIAPALVAVVGLLTMAWRAARVIVPAMDALLALNRTTARMDARAAKMEDKQDEAAQTQREMLDHLKVQAAEQAALRAQVLELHDYAHEGIHAIRDGLGALAVRDTTTKELVARLGEVAQELRDLPGRESGHRPPRRST